MDITQALLAIDLDSADDVAAFFMEAGIKGPSCGVDSKECPVARYLSDVCGEPISVGVWDAGPEDSSGHDGRSFPLPNAVRKFVSLFDQDKYPDLRSAS